MRYITVSFATFVLLIVVGTAVAAVGVWPTPADRRAAAEEGIRKLATFSETGWAQGREVEISLTNIIATTRLQNQLAAYSVVHHKLSGWQLCCVPIAASVFLGDNFIRVTNHPFLGHVQQVRQVQYFHFLSLYTNIAAPQQRAFRSILSNDRLLVFELLLTLVPGVVLAAFTQTLRTAIAHALCWISVSSGALLLTRSVSILPLSVVLSGTGHPVETFLIESWYLVMWCVVVALLTGTLGYAARLVAQRIIPGLDKAGRV